MRSFALVLPLLVASAIVAIGACKKDKEEAGADSGTSLGSSGGSSGDFVSPPTVEDDAGVQLDGATCPSIAHDDNFERDTVESPAWKLITGKANLELDGTNGIQGKSLKVSLLDGPAPRFGYLERGFPPEACRVTVSMKLRITTVPAEGVFFDVARIVVAGGLLSLRVSGSSIGLMEFGIAPNEEVTGTNWTPAGTVTADEVIGLSFVLDRRSEPAKIGLSLTEAAPASANAKYVLGRPRFLALGSAGANTGPDLDWRIDDVRIR